MGAIGAALLAMEQHQFTGEQTKFKGWQTKDLKFNSVTCTCEGCSNNCEVISIVEGEIEPLKPGEVHKIEDVKGKLIARWGGTCGRWDLG